MELRQLQRLDERYEREAGVVYLSGLQALVRVLLAQRARDRAAGLDTGGFVSGYRGSPLGGLDQQLWRAGRFLDRANIRFQPGLNEDLAATAVWGSQQVGLFPGARHDGVFGMWYGKGPGVDRSGDVFKHANAAGSARHGGVLAILGDDHGCKSSSLAHQSEHAMIDAMIPVLNPAGVQDVLDYGLYGYALSRFSGCWVGFKAISETMDSSAAVALDPDRVRIALPDDDTLPAGGLNIRWPDPPLEQEYRLHRYKLYAALAFARVNALDRMLLDSPRARLGIVTTGKSTLDVLQALEDLGLDAVEAKRAGLRVYKVAMSWPLEPEGIRRFARGLEEIIVVEEKRAIIENQLKEQLYNWQADARPWVTGKFDLDGEWLLPSAGELTPSRIARVIADRVSRYHESGGMRERLDLLARRERIPAAAGPVPKRMPHYCSGCPHNTSTQVPEGSRAIAGIGCHYMVMTMDRRTETFTQMGGEGVPWIGQAPFTETGHVFQNIGDGTYFHSGLLAIRAAVAAGVNITYKLLFNGAVAMTGGQPVDGSLSVPMAVRQLRAEGVPTVLVVTDEPERYREGELARIDAPVHHRRELPGLQQELAQTRGVSVLIYDQTCAAEKRRRRKRGLMPDPPKRAFIRVSNCLSIVPVETPYGRKRAIDQASCNKDFSCVEGFCPSFVTVHGGRLRRPAAPETGPQAERLPEPQLPGIEGSYSILVAGIGGTGVVTVSNLLGMAAHLEHRGVTVLDQTGLAQKFGEVSSHVRMVPTPDEPIAMRIPAGGADLMLGCDIVVSASNDMLAGLDSEASAAVINTHEDMPATFIRDPDLEFPSESLRAMLRDAAAEGCAHFMDATRLATRLLGDSVYANLLLLGYAWQRGLVPVSAQALHRAIELNGIAVDENRAAFDWGRRAAVAPDEVERIAGGHSAGEEAAHSQPQSLEALLADRVRLLSDYQNARYAERFMRSVRAVREAETEVMGKPGALTETVVRNLSRLMSYKDEYEVARLYTDGRFRAALERQFEGDFTLEVHLAPPLLARIDPATGRPRKRAFGRWMLAVFRVLAPLRRLRGSVLDPFGYAAERRMERALIADYEARLERLLPLLSRDNHGTMVTLFSAASRIRGFGPVKAEAVEAVRAREAQLEASIVDSRAGSRVAA